MPETPPTKNPKNDFIRLRVTLDEKEMIQQKARLSYRNLSEYVRDAALEHRITVVPGMDEVARELRRIGANLNRAVVLANQGKAQFFNLEPLAKEVGAVWQSVNSLLQNPR